MPSDVIEIRAGGEIFFSFVLFLKALIFIALRCSSTTCCTNFAINFLFGRYCKSEYFLDVTDFQFWIPDRSLRSSHLQYRQQAFLFLNSKFLVPFCFYLTRSDIDNEQIQNVSAMEPEMSVVVHNLVAASNAYITVRAHNEFEFIVFSDSLHVITAGMLLSIHFSYLHLILSF